MVAAAVLATPSDGRYRDDEAGELVQAPLDAAREIEAEPD